MGLIADKDYYADAGGSIVDAGSPKAVTLVARKGTVVTQKVADRYGLSLEEGEQETRYRGRDVEGLKATESNEDLARRGIVPDDTGDNGEVESGAETEAEAAPKSAKKASKKK